MMKKISAVLLILLGTASLVFLQGLIDAASADPDPAAQENPLELETINGYGLDGTQTLSEVQIAEIGDVVCYEDRLFRRFTFSLEHVTGIGTAAKNMLDRYPKLKNIYLVPSVGRVVIEPNFEEDRERFERYIERLKKTVGEGVTVIDPWEALSEHTDEYIFYLSEDSWTARGAYYVSAALCEAMGIDPIPLDAYEAHMYESFKGTLYSSTKKEYEKLYGEDEAAETIDFDDRCVYYLSPGSRNLERAFSEDGETIQPIVSKIRVGMNTFVGGNDVEEVLLLGDGLSEEKKDETLLFLADGTGNVLAPYLANYYGSVYVVNISHDTEFLPKLSGIIRKYGIDTVVISQRAARLGAGEWSAAISGLME